MFATGYTPIYPCHVSAQDMRTKPVGTGPFKFVEFKGNESVKLVRNADYWRKGHPYVDAIDWRIVANRSTRVLAFIAGEFDMTFSLDLTVALVRDIKSQLPKAVCELQPTNNTTNLIVNRNAAPFDDPGMRSALALALDRKAFIDILTEGQAKVGGVMLPGPEGSWGMPAEMVAALPGYGTDVGNSRGEARKIMAGLGYGAGNPLKLKVATRNIPLYRDPAVILIDQLKQIHVEAELDPIETNQWFAKVARGDYSVGLNLTAAALDDPDVNFYENYACGSERNYPGYCNPAVDKLIDRSSPRTSPGRSSCRASPAYAGSATSGASCCTTTASTTTGASTTSGWTSDTKYGLRMCHAQQSSGMSRGSRQSAKRVHTIRDVGQRPEITKNSRLVFRRRARRACTRLCPPYSTAVLLNYGGELVFEPCSPGWAASPVDVSGGTADGSPPIARDGNRAAGKSAA